MILLFSIGFLEVSWVDIFDIMLVSVLLYQVYKLMRGSVAVKIFLGVLSLYLLYLIVRALQMELLGLILGQFMGVGVLAAIILFQPEIRKFLLLVGKTTDFNKGDFWNNLFIWKKRAAKETYNITPIIEASKTLGGSNTGALIVISKDSELKFYAESGDIIDAQLSKRLLLSIFNKYSPLHDGAVIVFKGKIKAARCVLPVSESDSLPAQFGLRHRAALGMSEVTDTIVLIVSEETGQFSLARNGKLTHNLSPQELRKKVNDYLHSDEVKKAKEKEAKEEDAVEKEASKIKGEAKAGI
ncbi:diadenylate cyclase CdaA [Fulvivirga sediminis]|uniref:Diadenylate cyclase n=1 Tax=Fulvivirga sediminis TaxID=2803949 RepID=A0A937F6T3_9BACT|nr:diadenylate cyclase CdaA [Fulvivirga sediminis]MBL3655038.1 TIGR00159 family protein [Fulvivirga sediminis]